MVFLAVVLKLTPFVEDRKPSRAAERQGEADEQLKGSSKILAGRHHKHWHCPDHAGRGAGGKGECEERWKGSRREFLPLLLRTLPVPVSDPVPVPNPVPTPIPDSVPIPVSVPDPDPVHHVCARSRFHCRASARALRAVAAVGPLLARGSCRTRRWAVLPAGHRSDYPEKLASLMLHLQEITASQADCPVLFWWHNFLG